MRIVIDLQGAQARDSGPRGIGRYSRALAEGIIRNRGDHEVLLALNGAFPESVASIREQFRDLVGPEQIRVWTPLDSVSFDDPSNDARRLASEAYREFFLSTLNPDVVHISSPFEGFGDDAVISVGAVASIPTTATLYDLIPLTYPQTYFTDERFEDWYRNRLGQLMRADRLLAISQSSRTEAVERLQIDPARAIAVGTAADAQFRPLESSGRDLRETQRSLGLEKPFVLYTGGIEHRKNIEALIRAYANVSPAIRQKHQLAIVCSIHEHDRSRLQSLAQEFGLEDNELVLTGFVPEDDLVALYGTCKLFVFPSLHEGFGLPVLEAMCCGAPVIASDRSSLPEVVGLDEAMFDPSDEQAITALIERALTDDDYRSRLCENASERCSQFSWDKTATLAIEAMEELVAEKSAASVAPVSARPRMAYLSPIAPARSGIADYTEELLPYLSRYYDIDVIVQDSAAPIADQFVRGSLRVRSSDDFRENSSDYDRFLYHFGNSPFHEHMFDALERTGGVVVLHDFYLSGVVAHRQRNGSVPGFWQRELYRSHGYPALQYQRDCEDEYDVDWRYPCSGSVIEAADRVIVHSRNSLELAQKWFGRDVASKFDVVPLLRGADAEQRTNLTLGKGWTLDPTISSSVALGSWARRSLPPPDRGVEVGRLRY